MNQKEYEMIGQVVKEQLSQSSEEGIEDIRHLVIKLADEFQKHYPKFQRSRFIEGCGLDQSEPT